MWSIVWSGVKVLWKFINFLPTIISVLKIAYDQIKVFKKYIEEQIRLKKAKEAIEKAKKDKDTQDLENLY